jgi:hypothetical protein
MIGRLPSLPLQNEGRHQLPGPIIAGRVAKKSAPLTLRQGRVYGSRLGESANRLLQKSDAKKNPDSEPHCAPGKPVPSGHPQWEQRCHRNGGSVAGRIQQCGCRRALIFARGRRSRNRSNAVAALIVFAGIASVVVAFAIGLWFDADWATRDS